MGHPEGQSLEEVKNLEAEGNAEAAQVTEAKNAEEPQADNTAEEPKE